MLYEKSTQTAYGGWRRHSGSHNGTVNRQYIPVHVVLFFGKRHQYTGNGCRGNRGLSVVGRLKQRVQVCCCCNHTGSTARQLRQKLDVGDRWLVCHFLSASFWNEPTNRILCFWVDIRWKTQFMEKEKTRPTVQLAPFSWPKSCMKYGRIIKIFSPFVPGCTEN